MTVEIAVMNKNAIVLAADSMVTIGHVKYEYPKSFHSVNKIYPISKIHDVCIMVYGNAEFMGVPWETIIKIYRKKLDNRKFSRLEEYANDFLRFLEEEDKIIPESEQKKYFYSYILRHFLYLNNNIKKNIEKVIREEGEINELQIKEIINNIIIDDYKIWKRAKLLSNIPKNYIEVLIKKFYNIINDTIKDVFQRLPISETYRKKLIEISVSIFTRDIFPGNISGVVFAGFGEEDTFPSINSYKIEVKINRKLKYIKEKSFKINNENCSAIIPFAQSTMIEEFLEGISRKTTSILLNHFDSLLSDYNNFVIKNLYKKNDSKTKEYRMKLEIIKKNLIDVLKERVSFLTKKINLNPFLEMVEFLPKNELVELAELLIELTILKQKFSFGTINTVGGPIDVALISKWDGFAWIKRKQYFKTELNPN